MYTSINHNSMAANTARNLNLHYANLATSTQRLSSGLRINSAADDAAGLAIRELQRADIAALDQGARNANDAISMIQLADGALGIIDEKLIRMKELAEQAATGTYDSTQRLMIDSEFQAMAAEIDRIANATDFNGIHLLDGSLSGTHDGSGLEAKGAMKIHFGSGNDSAEDYYYVDIGAATLKGLGLGNRRIMVPHVVMEPIYQITRKLESTVSGWWENAILDPNRDTIILDIPQRVAGKDNGIYGTWESPSNAGDIRGMDYYDLPIGLTNITITSNFVKYNPDYLYNGRIASSPAHKPHVCLFTRDGKQLTGPPTYTVGEGEEYWQDVIVAPDGSTGDSHWLPLLSWWSNTEADTILAAGKDIGIFDASVTAIDSSSSMWKAGEEYKYVNGDNSFIVRMLTSQNEIGSEAGSYALSNTPSIRPPTVEEKIFIDKVSDALIFLIGGHSNPPQGCNVYSLKIEADISEEFLDTIGAHIETEKIQIGEKETLRFEEIELDESLSIETQEKAQQALIQIDVAIEKKDKIRAHLGALQNRLENTVSNLTIQAENLQAAESRISDVDVATEMTNFVRNRILTQSAVALLGQANSMPQMLMQLIGG